MTTDHEQLARLVGLTHEATVDLSCRTSALQLYRDARDVAEQRIPGPLGVAVAAVLATAAYQRAPVPGLLGSHKHHVALAIAVLSIVPGDETAGPTS